jgi:hypothetical protein
MAFAYSSKGHGFDSIELYIFFFFNVGYRNELWMSISEHFRYPNDVFQSDIFVSDIGITDVDVG